MPAFNRGDRVVLVDGRYAMVTATGVDGFTVESVDGEVIGSVKDTDLSVAVDEDFDRERRSTQRTAPPPD